MVARLKDAKNKHVALTLLLREFPHCSQLEQGVLQYILDLTWENFTSDDALAALEAIVDRDLPPS